MKASYLFLVLLFLFNWRGSESSFDLVYPSNRLDSFELERELIRQAMIDLPVIFKRMNLEYFQVYEITKNCNVDKAEILKSTGRIRKVDSPFILEAYLNCRNKYKVTLSLNEFESDKIKPIASNQIDTIQRNYWNDSKIPYEERNFCIITVPAFNAAENKALLFLGMGQAMTAMQCYWLFYEKKKTKWKFVTLVFAGES